MFGRAATDFAECMAEPLDCDDARAALITIANRFSDFCTDSPTRYQLLFQRTIPGFEPSPESYAPAMRALVVAQEQLALNGITEARHVDLWTALITGLVDQQVSNDLGGDRWTRLIEESVDMFLTRSEERRVGKECRSRGAP